MSSSHSHLSVRVAGEAQRCEQSRGDSHKQRGCRGGDAFTQARAQVAALWQRKRGGKASLRECLF